MRGVGLTSEGRLPAGALLAFLAVSILAATDLALDLRGSVTLGHVLAEGGVSLIGLLGASVAARRLHLMSRQVRAAKAEARSLEARLETTTAEAARWKSEAQNLLSGLSAAIERQFDRWKLSAAEKEVGLLLLKGLSHKEIAGIRAVSEATARQQARALYRKAGLSGRHDLASFFLEDLMLPAHERH